MTLSIHIRLPWSDIGVSVRLIVVHVMCRVSLWLAFGFLRGNCSSDKLIRDNTGGVWLPVSWSLGQELVSLT